MALFRRFRSANQQVVHEAFEKGEASFADEEGGEMVPTMIQETSMVMDDADGIDRDKATIDHVAPGSGLAAEVAGLEERARADVQTAEAALADAQSASDEADDAYKALTGQYRRDEVHGVAATVTGTGPKYAGDAQAEDTTVLSDRQRIEKDLATASQALADADAAKAQADADVERARRGGSNPPA